LSRARHAIKKPVKKRAVAVWIIVALFAAGLALTNAAVLFQPGKSIISGQEAQDAGAECILVLGARVD
jgi:hypothetical protein